MASIEYAHGKSDGERMNILVGMLKHERSGLKWTGRANKLLGYALNAIFWKTCLKYMPDAVHFTLHVTSLVCVVKHACTW